MMLKGQELYFYSKSGDQHKPKAVHYLRGVTIKKLSDMKLKEEDETVYYPVRVFFK